LVTAELKRRVLGEIAVFTVLAFALTWAIVGAYIVWPHEATALMGPMALGQPAFYAAVYAPSVVAFALCFAHGGLQNVSRLARAGLRWRAHWLWIALVVLGYPAFWLLWRTGSAIFAGDFATFDFDPWLVALPAIIISWQILRDPGALGEEFGWRGYMLPRLLVLTNARNTALVSGAIWAIWHLPAFYLSSLSQSQVNFPDFFLAVVGFSIVMTLVFVNTKGSILWAGIVPHFLINATGRAGIPGDGWIFGLAALVLLLFAGKDLRFGAKPDYAPEDDVAPYVNTAAQVRS